MISRAEYIQQPYSGEYIEKIYDIKSPWNSTDWTWIKFTEEDDIWCGEFRGKYRGVSCSTTLGIIVVLTSDYMYVLDIYGGEIMEYYSQPEYVDITVTPFGKILVTDGYGIEMFANTKISDMENSFSRSRSLLHDPSHRLLSGAYTDPHVPHTVPHSALRSPQSDSSPSTILSEKAGKRRYSDRSYRSRPQIWSASSIHTLSCRGTTDTDPSYRSDNPMHCCLFHRSPEDPPCAHTHSLPFPSARAAYI